MEVKFNSSDKVTNLLAAYNKFQALDLVAVKHGSNPHFKSTFAKLPDILELVRDPLSDNGLCVIQMPLGGTDDVSLLCRLTHTSGEYFQWVYSAPLSQKDVQKVCATITYLRRTSLLAVLGIPDQDFDGNDAVITQEQYTPTLGIPDQDFDGNDAVITQEQYTPTLKQNPPRKDLRDSPLSTAPKGKGPSPAQIKRLFAITKSAGYEPSDVEAFIKVKWGLSSVSLLDWKQYQQLCGDEAKGVPGIIPNQELKLPNGIPQPNDIPYDESPFSDF